MIDRDRALIERLLNDGAIKGLMADFLTMRFEQTAALLSAARDEGRAEGLGGEWNSINRVPLPIGREVIVGKWFALPDGNVIWDQEIYTAYDAGWRAEWGDDKPTHWTDTPAPPASQTQEG